jgi:uncharacterized membrane protein YccC
MKLLHTIGSELLGLFVDDWGFALLIIAWVVFFAIVTPHVHRTPALGALFFAGFALLTLAFALRKAR